MAATLKQQMYYNARELNGKVAFSAALAVANALQLEDNQARSAAQSAAMQSLIKPVVVSVYADLPEATIDMLQRGDLPEFLVTKGDTGDRNFNPMAVKYNAAALMALLIPMVQPIMDGNPKAIELAAAALVAGLVVLKKQWKQQVTGDDAEVIIILKKMTNFERTLSASEAFLLAEINDSRRLRGVPALTKADFDSSVQRLLAYEFIDYDKAAAEITLKG